MDGLPGGGDCGEGDHENDEQPREIFGTAEPVGVAARGCTPAEDEGNPQRNSGERVGEIMDGISQERDGTAEDDHDSLKDGCDQQDQKADLQSTDA